VFSVANHYWTSVRHAVSVDIRFVHGAFCQRVLLAQADRLKIRGALRKLACR